MGSLSIQDMQARYRTTIPTLQSTFNDYFTKFPLCLKLATNEHHGYGDAISAVCKEIATVYNNHYVETFQERIENYLMFKLQLFLPTMELYLVKKIVLNYGIFIITETEAANVESLDFIADQEKKRTDFKLFPYIASGSLGV